MGQKGSYRFRYAPILQMDQASAEGVFAFHFIASARS